jgi:hypothetical protein
MKKGFLHVVEIVIVSLVMFIIISQFSALPKVNSNWPGTKLFLQANDIIYALDSKGVNWLDSKSVSREIEKILPNSTKYDLKVKNTIKPMIYVGCLCSDTEYSEVTQALTQPPFMNINDENIQFLPERINPSSPEFPIRYDVIIIGQTALIQNGNMVNYRDQIEAYLSYDKGVLEIVDLESSNDVTEIQRDIFNLKWDSSLFNPSTNRIGFSINRNSYELVPPIDKYFYHFPNASNDFYPDPHTFGNFLASGEKINVSDGKTDKIIMKQELTAVPAAIINYNMVNSVGRTAWLSNGPFTDDTRVLVKSITAWAAGDVQYVMSSVFSSEEAVSFSFFKVLNKDMYQPIEILFTMGYLYTTRV